LAGAPGANCSGAGDGLAEGEDADEDEDGDEDGGETTVTQPARSNTANDGTTKEILRGMNTPLIDWRSV
jgi:hypothetical protein